MMQSNSTYSVHMYVYLYRLETLMKLVRLRQNSHV